MSGRTTRTPFNTITVRDSHSTPVAGYLGSPITASLIDIDDIRDRYERTQAFLDERGRRLFAANEALAQGRGGDTAVAAATGVARSTINRGIQELRSGRNPIGSRVRRGGGGRKSAVTHQPELPAALEALIDDAIRSDPCSPLRWVSRTLRHLVKALAAQGFQASQRVVANLLRELKYSCQANQKTREGGNHPDRDAQFAHINTMVKAAIAAGEPAILPTCRLAPASGTRSSIACSPSSRRTGAASR
jgi:hypothetical protein